MSSHRLFLGRHALGRLAAATTAAALTLGVAACGSSDPEELTDDTTPSEVASTDCADDQTTTSTDPVTLTDDLGRTIELDKPAERVAALEWQQIEDTLTLCVTPVGVADAEGFSTWVTAEELPKGVKDVGLRGEPNFNALFATNPDLVIVEVSAKDDPIIKKLEKYDVPVLATTGADTADPIQKMKDTFNLIAQATGREERAEAVLAEFDDRLAEGKEEMADSQTTDFVYFDGWIAGGNVAIRPFGQGSLVGEVGEELGLTNAWTGDVDEVYGLGQTDLEGMTEVGDATLIHTGTEDESDVVAELEKSRLWKGLPAVEEGRAYSFPPGIWTFGGPASTTQIIDAYVDALS